MVGNPKVVNMSNIVIRAALGIDAAPMLASVAVKLEIKYLGQLITEIVNSSCVNIHTALGVYRTNN